MRQRAAVIWGSLGAGWQTDLEHAFGGGAHAVFVENMAPEQAPRVHVLPVPAIRNPRGGVKRQPGVGGVMRRPGVARTAGARGFGARSLTTKRRVA